MFSEWLQLQWVILPILAIPLAILLGMRWANGAILVTAVGALLAIAGMWYRNATVPVPYGAGGDSGALDSVFVQMAWVLLLATWALTLAHAVRSRRWLWLGVIVVAGYLSYSALLLSELLPEFACASSLSDGTSFPACTQPDQAIVLLITLGKAIAPIAGIIYALRATDLRRRRQLPEGLVASSLRHGQDRQNGQDTRKADDEAIPAD